jgi:hypothetical protein
MVLSVTLTGHGAVKAQGSNFYCLAHGKAGSDRVVAGRRIELLSRGDAVLRNQAARHGVT